MKTTDEAIELRQKLEGLAEKWEDCMSFHMNFNYDSGYEAGQSSAAEDLQELLDEYKL